MRSKREKKAHAYGDGWATGRKVTDHRLVNVFFFFFIGEKRKNRFVVLKRSHLSYV